ncbi:MAG: hypothetical protein GC147_11805 [Porphyrobacter sp.]|nr:hypothetical protein [Porphyrobacter sp.]
MRLARTKSGTNGGPLLTRPTFALDQEAELTFGAQGGAHLAVSAFDRGGWGGESPDDAINRLVNGENPAARGLAISLADLPLGGGESAGGASLSMRVERFVTPIAPGAATSADLAMRMRF